jgi:hypothetical protein
MQPAAVQSEWTVPSATERCRILRHSLLARGVPEAQLDALWPGTHPERDPASVDAWVQTWGDLRVALAREEDQRTTRDAHVGAVVAESLAKESEPVALSVPGGPWAVYPKSYHTLRFLDMLDATLRLVSQRCMAVAGEDDALEAIALAPLLESRAVRLWAWILTHPGTGLPFDETEADPEPPAWTREIAPEDLMTLASAHLTVHAKRLALMSDAFPAEEGGPTRLSLAGFLGTQAAELGVRPADLMRSWSLGEAFASAITSAQAAREARAHAEQKAKARP